MAGLPTLDVQFRAQVVLQAIPGIRGTLRELHQQQAKTQGAHPHVDGHQNREIVQWQDNHTFQATTEAH
jgi:hypothetical protein